MLIFLENSLVVESSSFSNEEIAALSNLALSSLDGSNLVVCERNLARSLANDMRLGLRERSFFISSIQEFTSLGSVIYSCSYFIKVIRGRVSSSCLEQDGRICFERGLLEFSTLDSVACPKLICENIDDSKVLMALGASWLRNSQFRGLRLKFEMIPGGGDTTDRVVDAHLKLSSRFILCVVDTDKRPGKWRLGDTAKKVKKVEEETLETKLKLFILPCHEIENLIPDELLDDPNEKLSLACIESAHAVAKLADQGHIHPRLYLDFKKGLLLKDVFASLENNIYSKDWSLFYNDLYSGGLSGVNISDKCVGARSCLKANCECILYRPFGEGVLDEFERELRRDGKDILSRLPQWSKAIVDNLCKILFCSGCAAARSGV